MTRVDCTDGMDEKAKPLAMYHSGMSYERVPYEQPQARSWHTPTPAQYGTIVVHVGQPRLSSTMRPKSDIACPFETQYFNIYDTGAVAAMCKKRRTHRYQLPSTSSLTDSSSGPTVGNPPSSHLYTNDGSRGARTRRVPMPFLLVGSSDELNGVLTARAPGQNATVFPDVDIWRSTFASWCYQLFVRALSSTVLIVSGVPTAAYYHRRLQEVGRAGTTIGGEVGRLCGTSSWIAACRPWPSRSWLRPCAAPCWQSTGFFSTPNLSYSVAAHFRAMPTP